MRLEKLKVWKMGFDIVIKTYKMTKFFPKEEKYGLSSQMTKAAVSIPSNVSEGSSRSSQKEYARFLEIALGSSFELETQMLIARELELMSNEESREVLGLLEEEQKMLTSLISVVNKS